MFSPSLSLDFLSLRHLTAGETITFMPTKESRPDVPQVLFQSAFYRCIFYIEERAQIRSGWLAGIIMTQWTHLGNSTPAPSFLMLPGIIYFLISNAIH